jgi:sugar O-acyltransferase (sialic acid O-acetyltransferase NeuD family)
MSIPIIIVGAGGHAKVVLEALRRGGTEILGLVDSDREKAGKSLLGAPIIGGDEAVAEYAPGDIWLAIGLGPISQRRKLFDAFKDHAYEFANVIHPAATIADSVQLGEGVQIMAGAIIQADARIGDNVIINTGATIDHDCVIGGHVHIAPGATLAGSVRIGAGSLVGAGSTILENVGVGKDCIIAGGAVVISDVADDETVAGVPAIPISNKEHSP